MFANPRIGLQNLGNTCYSNVCIQIFLACHTTRHYIESAESTIPALARLFRRIAFVPSDVVSPHVFLFSLRDDFQPSSRQHDAAEFLLYLLTDVVDRVVQHMYAHNLTVTTTCYGCKASSVITTKDYIFAIAATSADVSIQNAIASTEVPIAFERKCEACSCLVSHQVSSISPSHVLLIQIKRFVYDVRTDTTSKLYGVVRISRTLTFAGVPYELRLVVLHIGEAVDQGHYICDVVDSTGERIAFNDSTTGPIPAARSAKATPYLLMYVRL